MNRVYQLSFLLLLGVTSSVSHATDVEVHIEGNVLDQTCNVKAADKEKYVTFLDLNQSDFQSAGDVSAAESVTVGLEGCTSSLSGILYTFSGDSDGIRPDLLKVVGADSSSIVADGLAIEILDSAKNHLNLAQQYTLSNPTIQNGAHDFKFFLRFQSVKASVTAGDASSVLYLDFDYE